MKTVYFQTSITQTDLRLLDETQLPQVAQELRDFIIDIVAKKKVILAQALGIELTIALHYVLTPQMIY
jgi:1-deoxy-D-xylulose-5-phosphate synthase